MVEAPAPEPNPGRVRAGLAVIVVVLVIAVVGAVVIDAPFAKAIMVAIAFTTFIRAYLIYRSIRREGAG